MAKELGGTMVVMPERINIFQLLYLKLVFLKAVILCMKKIIARRIVISI